MKDCGIESNGGRHLEVLKSKVGQLNFEDVFKRHVMASPVDRLAK